MHTCLLSGANLHAVIFTKDAIQLPLSALRSSIPFFSHSFPRCEIFGVVWICKSRKDTSYYVFGMSGIATHAKIQLQHALTCTLRLMAVCVQALEDMLNHDSEFVQIRGSELLNKIIRNPHVKRRLLTHPLLPVLITSLTSVDSAYGDATREGVCDALRRFSGNAASVNMEYRTAMLDLGFLPAAVALLSSAAEGTRRAAMEAITSMACLPIVQQQAASMQAIPLLVEEFGHTRASGNILAATCRALASLCKQCQNNRFEACRLGALASLAALLQWEAPQEAPEPEEPPARKPLRAGLAPAEAAQGAFREALKFGKRAESAKAVLISARVRASIQKQRAREVLEKRAHKTMLVRTAAAEAISALLDCAGCRRSYIGLNSHHFDLQGRRLPLPSMAHAYSCPFHIKCKAVVDQVSACENILQHVSDMLSNSNVPTRCAGALLLAALAVGSPRFGVCHASERVRNFSLQNNVLENLLSMLTAAELTSLSEKAAQQFAAARALAALAVMQDIKRKCCSMGFLRPLGSMLFSTYGRVKGAAAVALARLSGTDSLCFYWNKQTNATFWDVPQDVVYVQSINGLEKLADEDVTYDETKKVFWVRGIMKPYERILYCDMLTSIAPVQYGAHQGMVTLKADNKMYSRQVTAPFTPVEGDLVQACYSSAFQVKFELLAGRSGRHFRHVPFTNLRLRGEPAIVRSQRHAR
jgi:hypothetical protein